MKSFYFVLLLFAFTLPVSAAIDVHRLSLQGFSLPLQDFNFYVEQVLDVREVENYIGFVRKGLSDKKVPAMLGEQSAAVELQALFSRSYTNDRSKTALTVRLNKLLIYEVIYVGKAYAFAEINLSFFTKDGDSYQEIYETGTMVTKQGMEVTGSHEKNIIQALDICFRQFRDYAKLGNLRAVTVVANELMINPVGKRQYPIVSATEYPKGVYRTLSDFRANTPDASVAFTVTYEQKKKQEGLEATPTWADKTFHANAIWGFSDGKDIFKNMDGAFYLVKKEESDFIIHAPSLDKGGNVMTGALLGGLVGALLANALDDSKGKEMKYKIDFSTGAVTPLNEPDYKRIEARSAIYFTSFAKEGSQLTVIVDGEERCTLQPGEYYVLRSKPAQTTQDVCIISNGEKNCQQIAPELLKTEAYLCRIEKKGTPVIESPSSGTLQSVQERIREGKAKEKCSN